MVKYLILITTFCTCSDILKGQNQKLVDSLRCEILDKKGREKANLMLDLAIEYIDIDNKEAMAIIQCALEEACASRDTSTIVTSMRLKGQVMYRLERTDEAIGLFQTTIAIAKENGFYKEEMMSSLSFAINLMYRSQYDKALQKLFRAQEIAILLNDTSSYELSLNNIGVVYYKLKDYRKALYYWSEAMRVQKIQGNISHGLNLNISLAYANLKDFANARQFLNESAVRCGLKCPDDFTLHIKYASGYISLGLGELHNAEAYFLESYEYSKKQGDHRMLLDNIYLLAEIYQKQDMMDKALHYLNEGEGLIKQGLPYNLEITKVYRRLSELYLAARNFERASFYQAKYISLKDSIYNDDLTTSLMSTESELLERANRAQISSHKQIIELKEQIIHRQTILSFLTTLLAATISAFCFFLYRSFRKKKQVNVSLEEKIKERTYELECSRNELLRSLSERDMLIGRAATEISQTVRSIRGLCSTGKHEVSRSVLTDYFERIETTSRDLSRQLSFLCRR